MANDLIAARAFNPVHYELHHEVEQFLYYEAALLDDRQFSRWSELLADDLHYVAPIRTDRGLRERDQSVSGPGELAYFDDSKESMQMRIRKLETGSAWAEEPPSRTRHIVSNIQVSMSECPNHLDVRCAFIVYKNRGERQTELFVGERQDKLRRSSSQIPFQIVTRRILIDQTTLNASNISFFF